MLGPEDKRFIDWIGSYLSWYEKESRTWHAILTICKIFALISSLISIVIAASVTKEFFDNGGKWLIVAATVLSALSSEWLAQFRVREMEDLREQGRIEVAHLFGYAQGKFDEFAEDRTMVNKVKAEIRGRIRKLEEGQHRGFVDIDSGGTAGLHAPGRP